MQEGYKTNVSGRVVWRFTRRLEMCHKNLQERGAEKLEAGAYYPNKNYDT